MAIAIVGKGLSGSTATNLLAISPTATAGDMLYCFFSETTAVAAPTVTDNLAGTWTVESTSGETSAVSASIWFAWKKAVGGENEIKVTPGAGATGQGLCYLEASGAAAEAPEHILSTGKQATSLTHASPEITAAAGSLIFIGFGLGASAAEVASWNNAMSNIAETASRCPGGYFISAEALTNKVFTETLKVTKAGGLLAVVLKPSSEAPPSFSGTSANQVALTQSVTGNKVASSAVAQRVAMPQALGAGQKVALGSITNRMGLAYGLSQQSVGVTSIGGSTEEPTVNAEYAQPIATARCTVSAVAVYCEPGTAVGGVAKLKPVLYAVGPSHPSTLLAEGPEITYTQTEAAGWRVMPLSAPYHVTPGQTIAYGFLLGGTAKALKLATQTGAGVCYAKNRTYAEGPQNPWEPPSETSATAYSMYALLTYDDMGYKIAKGIQSWVMALVNAITGGIPGEVFSGTVTQVMAFTQSITGRKVASSSPVQRLALRDVLGAGRKTAAGTSVQRLALTSLTTGLKRAAGAITQLLGFTQHAGAEPVPEKPPEDIHATATRIEPIHARAEGVKQVGRPYASVIRRRG